MSKKWKKKYKKLRAMLKGILSYPTPDNPRRTDDGYPSEFEYDEYAYKRMVDSYRRGIRKALKAKK